jgi:hypothetical protein
VLGGALGAGDARQLVGAAGAARPGDPRQHPVRRDARIGALRLVPHALASPTCWRSSRARRSSTTPASIAPYHMAHHRYTPGSRARSRAHHLGHAAHLGQLPAAGERAPVLRAALPRHLPVPFGFRATSTYIDEKAWPEVRRWPLAAGVLCRAARVARSRCSRTCCVGVADPAGVGAPCWALYLLCEPRSPNSRRFAKPRTTLCNPLLRFWMWNLALPRRASPAGPTSPFHHLPERIASPGRTSSSWPGAIPAQREIVRSFQISSRSARAG